MVLLKRWTNFWPRNASVEIHFRKVNSDCGLLIMKQQKAFSKLKKLNIGNMMNNHLLHSVKTAVIVTDHVAMGGPLSVHMLICPLAGMRLPLHEYSNVSPARNCAVRALAGIVTALAGAATGTSQTEQRVIDIYVFCHCRVPPLIEVDSQYNSFLTKHYFIDRSRA